MQLLRSRLLPIVPLLLCTVMLGGLDLGNPGQYLESFLRVRSDLDGKESFLYWTGKVYGVVPGERRTELFDIEGYMVSRLQKQDDGYLLLGKEAAFLKDSRTGEILSTWRNPYLKNAEMQVIHIWNNPVNQNYTYTPDELRFISKSLPSQELGDNLVFYQDIFPFYDSPLPRKEFSQYSQSDVYQASEFFQYFTPQSAVRESSANSLPCHFSITKITPWLPFMKMGDRKGNLVFVGRGMKLEGGFEALPGRIKQYVTEHEPDFSSAPLEYSQPNQTSWSYFKQLMQTAEPEK